MIVRRLLSAFLLVATSFATTAMAQKGAGKQPQFQLCHSEYALCTFATCGPAKGPKGHQTTVCSCRVWRGYSVAAVKPVRGKKKGWYCDGLTITPKQTAHVISRYYPIPGYGTCADDSQWAMCLDDECTVDPNHKNRANCTCQVESRKTVEPRKKPKHPRNYDYLAQYGQACGGGIISSATVLDLHQITKFLREKSDRRVPVQPFIKAGPQTTKQGK